MSSPRRGFLRAEGFTMVELVVVIAMISLLAAIAGPRFVGTSVFEASAYRERVQAALTHARDLSIASGCEVQVTLAGGFALLQRQACQTGNFDRPVPDPGGESGAYAEAPPSGVVFTSTQAELRFDALGRARNAAGSVVDATLNIGTHQLQVEGETGFSHGS